MGTKTGNPVGRPKQKKLPRGRPKGQETIMKEYRMRMLNSPKSAEVLRSIFEVASDPEHKHWPAASKMVLDRVAPAASFLESNSANGAVQGITVNITGVPGVNISSGDSEGDVVQDADFTEVEQ